MIMITAVITVAAVAGNFIPAQQRGTCLSSAAFFLRIMLNKQDAIDSRLREVYYMNHICFIYGLSVKDFTWVLLKSPMNYMNICAGRAL